VAGFFHSEGDRRNFGVSKNERVMKLKGGILITARDIMLITGTMNEDTATREHRTIRDSLGKVNKRLTVQEYCRYWDLNFEDIVEFLNLNR
jgi:hypothetical protein